MKTIDEMPPCFLGRASRGPRAILQAILLWPLVRWFCHPRTVVGRCIVKDDPVVFVANHSSHADTAVILRSLPRKVRRRTHPAAAEDHFWRRPSVGAFVSLLTGAFPFPRKGSRGLDRAERLLDHGRNVLIFPEGTRSPDGEMSSFHCGVGKLAAGRTVIPIGVAGTHDVLPKGSTRPSHAPVAVAFGDSMTFEESASPMDIARSLGTEVAELVTEAERVRGPHGPTVYERLQRLGMTRIALLIAFIWAFAEAVAWPVVPDLFLLPLAIVVPGRIFRLIGATLVGTISGGLVAYALGGTPAGGWILEHAPLVTDRMTTFASSSLVADGAGALTRQPWSGVPFKTFAYQAAPSSVDPAPFLAVGALARGLRFLVVGLLGAFLGKLLRPLWQRALGPLLILYMGVFAVGLGRVVAAWN